MGKIQGRKTKLLLSTEDSYRHGKRRKAIMIELKPEFLYVWLSGTRTKFQITYSSIYERAAWLAARYVQLEKARAKKAARQKKRGA